MAITNPTLPPKAGYVEVEVDGKRTYRNVETGVLIDDEGDTAPNLEARVSALEETAATWDALDAAYTEGVNSAYDE